MDYVWGVAKISFLTREGAVFHNYLIMLPSFICFKGEYIDLTIGLTLGISTMAGLI